MSRSTEVYTWSLVGDELKSFIGIHTTNEDAKLQLYLGTAAEQCEKFLGRYYVDTDGTIHDDTLTEPHPFSIKQGVFEFVRVMREVARRAPGLLSKVTDRESESYGPSGGDMVSQALSVSEPLWIDWKFRILNFSNYIIIR